MAVDAALASYWQGDNETAHEGLSRALKIEPGYGWGTPTSVSRT